MLDKSNFTYKNRILEYDGRFSNDLSSPLFSEKFRKYCMQYDFDRLIIHTKYLNKEYDNNFNLISVEPFFVDVTLYNPYKNYEVVEEYYYPGIFIRILNIPDIVEYFYEVEIEEYSLNVEILKKIYKDAEDYEKTGKTNNLLIKRWYQDFGILEYLVKDEKVLEININPPGYKTPIRILHEKYGECVTNIYPSQSFLDYFVTRLKMRSGRPLNKVFPELDTELVISGVKIRISVVIGPFSIFGPGFSIRKHREKPWTFELFMRNRMINSLFAGFMSLIIAHGRSYIVAGPRGSGKTSLMTASLLEIPTNNRLITIEDTQEIPINYFKKLGYDLLSLKVRSALLEEGMEIDFEKGLRTTLRLGDSCLILGEIRGKEAKVLYEAMRVGAMSNVVTGTIHADTAYGVYDRVVNDLGVTKGSFKVTDFIVLVNLIKDATGTRKIRRVVEVVEVLKDWEDEPKFLSLLKYNSKTDQLEPTENFLQKKSQVFRLILKNTKNYSDYEDVLTDLYLREKIKEIILKYAKPEQLEAIYTKRYSTIFLKLLKNLSNFKNQNEINKILQEYERIIFRLTRKSN